MLQWRSQRSRAALVPLSRHAARITPEVSASTGAHACASVTGRMSKRLLVDCLSRDTLLDVARMLELSVHSRMPVADVRGRFTRSRRVTAEDILEVLRKDDLRNLCGRLGRQLECSIPVRGTVDDIRERLLFLLEPGWSEEPETGPGYREDAYRRRFVAEFAFQPESSPSRRYQLEAVRTALENLSPDQACLVQVATGGGKTRIGNDAVVARLAEERSWALWVSKDWRLLKQAGRDLARRHDGFGRRLRRLGGESTVLHPLPTVSAPGAVVYSTIQTMGRRLAEGHRLGRPGLVVWDECHWGEHGQTGRDLLRWCRAERIPVLGLTATPRPPQTSRFRTVFSKDFASLVREGHLARPVIEEPIRTGVTWDPRRANDQADFSAESLGELAQNARRNRLIVSSWDAQRHGKTIVFACSIEHADVLARLFTEAGVPAMSVHSQMSPGLEEEALLGFERGSVRVLVNVAKLTTGVDVPDVRSVFLCRPTLSDILFSQMVGRASRLHEPSGKTTFHIVEFTDNLVKFGEQLQKPKRYFSGFAFGERSDAALIRYPRGPRLNRPSYDPRGQPRWLETRDTVPEPLQGLWYRHGQSFGVEFEFTRDGYEALSDAEWLRTAEALRRSLEEVLPGQVASTVFDGYQGIAGDKDYGLWNVEKDGSCGWEVTSRVLRNEEGLAELALACEALEKAADEEGLRLNHRTGTHLHLGWLGKDVDEVKRALLAVRLFEPAVATLVAPSRLVAFEEGRYDLEAPNPYCQPVSQVFTARRLARVRKLEDLWRLTQAPDTRYVSFNIRPIEHIHTVEVRLHNGTVDARKLLAWVSLWQQILWIAANTERLPPVADRDVLEPDGDVVQLLQTFGPPQPPGFLERLHQRRHEVRELWREHPELATWAKHAEAWKAP